jgi:hypothetical protein
MFTAGAAIGSVVTWRIVKARYDRIIAEEIESVKEAFADAETCDEPGDEPAADDEGQVDVSPKQINWDDLEDLDEDEDEDMVEYSRIVENYTSEKGGARNMANEPKVISPYDFG